MIRRRDGRTVTRRSAAGVRERTRRRLAGPAPEYPALPEGSPVLFVRLSGWLVHEGREVALLSTRRCRTFRAETREGVLCVGGIKDIFAEIGRRIARPSPARGL